MTADRKTEKLIEDITKKIVKEYNPKKIVLFGSYAYGDLTDDSDIDLLTIKNTDETPMQRWVRLHKLSWDITGNIPLSPLVYTGEELRQRIRIKDFL